MKTFFKKHRKLARIMFVLLIALVLFFAYGFYLLSQNERGAKMADQGLALVFEGKYDEAELLLNRALETIPSYEKESHSLVYKNLAFMYEAQGKIDKTIENLEKAQHLFSDKESLYYSYLGQIQLYTREVEKLVSNLQKAIELDPKNADAYNLLGMLYMGQLINEVPADFEKALPYNEKAYELNPTPVMMENLAVNDYQVNNFEESLELFKQLDELRAGKDPFSRYFIGMIYFRKEAFDLAQSYLKSAIELEPAYGTDEVKKILDLIES